MLKTIRKAWSYWPYATAFLLALIFVYAVSRSSTFKACYGDHQQYASYKQQQESLYVLSWVFRNFKVGLKCGGVWAEHSHGILTALATFAIAGFTFTLWKSTRNLWAVTKQSADAFASAERPHLLVAELNLFVHFIGGVDETSIGFTFKIDNFGRSPGFVTKYIFQFESGDLPPSPKYDSLWSDKNIIVPGHWMKSVRRLEIAKVSTADAQKIINDELPVYVFGLIEYKSIFGGNPHKKRFCYRLSFGGSQHSGLFQPDGPDSYWEYT